jgi:hypothetical protein
MVLAVNYATAGTVRDSTATPINKFQRVVVV